MSLTYLKYGKQLTVTFPIFLMKWKRQSSIFFWLNIIYIRTTVAKGILLDVRLPIMSRANAQQITPPPAPPPSRLKRNSVHTPPFWKNARGVERCRTRSSILRAIRPFIWAWSIKRLWRKRVIEKEKTWDSGQVHSTMLWVDRPVQKPKYTFKNRKG